MIGYGNSMFLGSTLFGGGGGGIDPDAQAFITAAAITDPTQQSAINQLVVDLKGYSIWTKMKAIYPFVGGTSTTHKYNLVNPLDTDAAFRLVFSGGWTHSVNGALPNGTNGWADTFVKTGTDLALNSTHVSVYSRTNNSTAAIAIGNTFGGGASELSMWLRDSTVSYLRVNTNNLSSVSNLDSSGLFIGNRNSSTVQTLSIRGTQNNFNVNSNQTTNSFTINLSSAIGAFSATRAFYDNKQYAFASIGDGLTSQNMTDLDTIITTFQTALNRNV